MKTIQWGIAPLLTFLFIFAFSGALAARTTNNDAPTTTFLKVASCERIPELPPIGGQRIPGGANDVSATVGEVAHNFSDVTIGTNPGTEHRPKPLFNAAPQYLYAIGEPIGGTQAPPRIPLMNTNRNLPVGVEADAAQPPIV